MDARSVQGVAGLLVEVGGSVVIGNEVGMVAGSTGHEFAAEAGVFVNLKHVDADVRYSDGDDVVQGCSPAFGGLVREAGDEIDAEVSDAGLAKQIDVGQGDGTGMEATDGTTLFVNEGLHAEADAVHPAAQQ